jgi:cytochrome-b5 reductase
MLSYKTKKGLKYKATLIYSNTTKDTTAFEKELNKFAARDNNLSIFYTITRDAPKSWKGLKGRIDKKILQDILLTKEVPTSHFWISGPPAMVDSMEKAVESIGVNPDNIRLDKFSGY